LNSIKLFITDIDGVWTDGGMYYDETGNEWKKFNTSDSAGVLFLKLLGIPTAIITGENTKIVKRRAEKLKIEDCFLGISDKVEIAQKLRDKYNLKWEEMAYIGDDINDIHLLKKVGLSACPYNAPDYIKNLVDWQLTKSGGEGAYREFVEKYLIKMELMDKALELFLTTSKSLNQ
tara:strand:- start:627541 stop:628065 length:525 start_codon:yes stop_codon:yes gene_type:complete